ncbi:MAG: YlmC/YmxH family sporulation protein [Clostridia bacterium]|nr:YlmC/YmxH family sporulation protein [Clostridia bacterium]
MKCSIMDLLEKSVINTATGERIGNLCDVELDTENACLCALIVQLKAKPGSFFGKCEKVRIDWCHIRIIGKDAILIDCTGDLKHVSPDKGLLEKIWN